MSQTLMVVLFGPPCIAGVWWLLSHGWGKTVQGGSVSERTKKRQRVEFWVLLVL